MPLVFVHCLDFIVDKPSNRRPAGDKAVRRVLAAFGLPSPREVHPAGGTASPKWLAASAQWRFVVRVRPAEFAGEDSIRFDHAVLQRLGEAGLPVPVPSVRPDGSTWVRLGGSVYEVLSWIEGRPFEEGDKEAICAVGSFLGRFHSALGDNIPPGKAGQLREDHPDSLSPYLVRLRELASCEDYRRQLGEVARQIVYVRQRLDRELYRFLPHCVIHGDVHPGNVRFCAHRVAAVYDFDYLGVQARARDVSDGLISFASRRSAPLVTDDIRSLTQPFFPDLDYCRLLLRGYQDLVPLADIEWDALSLLMRSRWIQMRLRGSRKVPEDEKVGFVLDRFFEVVDWLDYRGSTFFDELRSGL